MKIFEIQTGGEKEWIYAISTIQALREYCEITGTYLCDFEDDAEIIEIPESKWDELKISFPDEEKEAITFREYVKDTEAPHFMCSTCY